MQVLVSNAAMIAQIPTASRHLACDWLRRYFSAHTLNSEAQCHATTV